MLDDIAPATQTDLDDLLATSMGALRQLLTASRGFLPFAFSLSSDGVLSPVDVSGVLRPGRRTGDAAAAACLAVLRTERDGLRAAAVVSDVRLDGGTGADTDAVDITVEHRDGSVIKVLRPYTRSVISTSVEWGQATVYPAPARIWAG